MTHQISSYFLLSNEKNFVFKKYFFKNIDSNKSFWDTSNGNKEISHEIKTNLNWTSCPSAEELPSGCLKKNNQYLLIHSNIDY